MTAITGTYDRPIDPRLKVSALWTATMLIFAYVDLFSLYRPDVRADIEAERIFAFDINQTFLFFTTLYVIVPSLMIYLTLVMRPRLNRLVNLAVASLYALTIIGGAVGEWGYYVLGSVVEVVLLALIARHAWSWQEGRALHASNGEGGGRSTIGGEPGVGTDPMATGARSVR